jgi:hypothetical protein
MGENLDAIRAAVETAKGIAGEFHTAELKFFNDASNTPVLICMGRLRKPRPSAFDAGNQTEWATKRVVVAKIPLGATTDIIQKGWYVQVSTTDGDPSLNHVTFTVQSSLVSQFAAEREVLLATEVSKTPRIT